MVSTQAGKQPVYLMESGYHRLKYLRFYGRIFSVVNTLPVLGHILKVVICGSTCATLQLYTELHYQWKVEIVRIIIRQFMTPIIWSQRVLKLTPGAHLDQKCSIPKLVLHSRWYTGVIVQCLKNICTKRRTLFDSMSHLVHAYAFVYRTWEMFCSYYFGNTPHG